MPDKQNWLKAFCGLVSPPTQTQPNWSCLGHTWYICSSLLSWLCTLDCILPIGLSFEKVWFYCVGRRLVFWGASRGPHQSASWLQVLLVTNWRKAQVLGNRRYLYYHEHKMSPIEWISDKSKSEWLFRCLLFKPLKAGLLVLVIVACPRNFLVKNNC